jgi:hypothetical protein
VTASKLGLHLPAVNIFHFYIIIMTIHEKIRKIVDEFDSDAGVPDLGIASTTWRMAGHRGGRWTADLPPRIVADRRAELVGAGAP